MPRYQQRRLLGGFRHMHRRAVFDPRTKRWEASVYFLRDRPSDGEMVPTLSPVGVLNTEGQVISVWCVVKELRKCFTVL